MRRILILAVIAFFSLGSSADDVHYLGFNKFVGPASGESFDRYIRDLAPILDKYEMTIKVFDVTYGGSDQLNADAITFGTAKDQATMMAFFQDPELQAIFPLLVAALSTHQVVFTDSPFAPGPSESLPVLLTLDWLADKEVGNTAFQALGQSLKLKSKKYGIEKLSSTAGIVLNKGLAGEIKSLPAPDILELWTMRDAHGFYDDPQVRSTNKQIQALVSRNESFWLKPREL